MISEEEIERFWKRKSLNKNYGKASHWMDGGIAFNEKKKKMVD